MKKKMRKLVLNRETLHALDNLHKIVGGVSDPCTNPCARRTEGPGCETGTGSLFPTCWGLSCYTCNATACPV
jgi:hypothetical protein